MVSIASKTKVNLQDHGSIPCISTLVLATKEGSMKQENEVELASRRVYIYCDSKLGEKKITELYEKLDEELPLFCADFTDLVELLCPEARVEWGK